MHLHLIFFPPRSVMDLKNGPKTVQEESIRGAGPLEEGLGHEPR